MQPAFPYPLEQSTSYYSERETVLLYLIKLADSRAPFAEKAQQEPHYPWFLTGVTPLLFLQSTAAGSPVKLNVLVPRFAVAVAPRSVVDELSLVGDLLSLAFNKLANSSVDKSENWLTSTVEEFYD